MGRYVANEAGDEAAAKAAESNSGKPLEPGRYLATILPTKKDGTIIEEVPAAKEGPNSSKRALNVRFRIADGQTGQGRNLFARIPLFRKWAPSGNPSAKYPDGTPAFLYFQFFKALGVEVGNPNGDNLPDDRDILGKTVELVVAKKPADANNDSEYNEVSFINAATAPAAVTSPTTPGGDPWGATAGGAQAPWGTPAPGAHPSLQDAAQPAFPGQVVPTSTAPANDPWATAPAAQPVPAGAGF